MDVVLKAIQHCEENNIPATILELSNQTGMTTQSLRYHIRILSQSGYIVGSFNATTIGQARLKQIDTREIE